ncbi:MAG: DUF1116 domain-containing protein [Lentisphaerae bacterium]|nr:DUF1116 domain-containing protein [Lentisphaerota bacterium]
MNLSEKIAAANERAVNELINANPVWVDIQPAGKVVDGLEPNMILHSGPPIDFADMAPLHRRGMISGALYEGLAKSEDDAIAKLSKGEIKVSSALDHNTVGSGTGIITPSIAMMVIENQNNGVRAATFPAEGPFQGGLCGWGLYSEDIAANLRYMRDKVFPVLRELIKRRDGIPLKPIIAEGLRMGDEHHSRQSAADLILSKQLLPELFRMELPREAMLKCLDYLVETPRIFHCLGQGASMASLLSAKNTPYSTMTVAFGGNGVEYGIKVAGLGGDEWFTAPSMMIKGRYTSPHFSIKDQLPWIGDSSTVECAGLGGIAAAASPIVCELRGLKLKDAIAITREMQEICLSVNPNYPIPNLDFDCLPCGIDIRKVVKTGITPELHGGMFSHGGGLLGAGSARIPMLCFEKALKAFNAKYQK